MARYIWDVEEQFDSDVFYIIKIQLERNGAIYVTQVWFGDKVDEIMELTGVTEDILWKAGFNLDDMDCWVAIPSDQFELNCETDDFGYKTYKFKGNWFEDTLPFWLYRILNDWEYYCVGYTITPFNDKIFITLHHA